MDEIQSQSLGAANATTTSSTAKKNNTEVSVEDFLKILSASISNPSISGESGGSDSGTDYISQLAQFTMLEQVQELSTNVASSVLMAQQQQALSMVGKQVKLLGNGEEAVTGKIDKVKFTSGYATIEVNGNDYLMSSILEVGQ